MDEWKVIERGSPGPLAGRMETVFALSNGYIGIRGTPDDMAPVHEPGTFVNGFYESWPIVYPEAAYGFATVGQTIVNVPDATAIRLTIDGEALLPDDDADDVQRTLDMRHGILSREVTRRTESGHVVRVQSRRLVSLEHRHLAAVSWELDLESGEADVVVSSEIFNQQDAESEGVDETDPRRGRGFARRVLLPVGQEAVGSRIVLGYRTQSSGLPLACGIDHIVAGEPPAEAKAEAYGDSGRVTFTVRARAGSPVRITKLISYHSRRDADVDELAARVGATLDRGIAAGFDELAESQRAALDVAWRRSDVRIEGRPELQQAVRWNLFQLIQATRCIDRNGVPAKGLTSQGYDGHYFWDMDMFFMPFLLHTRPDLARELLRFRYDTLDAARTRALEMSEAGALYPWRTINGEEASAFFPAGTAQYHINAAVAHAVKRYVEISGDDGFLIEAGAEIVLETARLWYDLGFFASDGRFHLHGVTGPDEYTALVNNNTYTNLMAQLHLEYAADVVDWLAEHHPDRYVDLADRIDLGGDEVEGWRRAAAQMVVLYDEERGIHPQDDAFLDLEVWDFANTEPDEYPLLLHHHPLVLYRRQVLKQSDVVLAMVTRGNLFSREQKARNFAYYEPLTTDDSSLSTPIQAIVAAEVGAADVASRCFEQGVFSDLADVYGNASDGVHLASCGATWMTLVMGFGGMREFGGRVSFDPRLPSDWESLSFSLTVRGRLLHVTVRRGEIELQLSEGEEIEVEVRGRPILLGQTTTETVPTVPEEPDE